jgi:hypothetical protein
MLKTTKGKPSKKPKDKKRKSNGSSKGGTTYTGY